MTHPSVGSFPVRAFTEGANSRVVGARLCHFKPSSAELLIEHKLWIDEVFIPKMRQHPNAWVDFLGSASRTGTPTSNYDLSRERNDKVEAYIKKTYPEIKVNIRVPLGADSESLKDDRKYSEGYYRAVVVRWYGVPLQIPVPTPPPEAPYRFRKYKAPEGCWLITKVKGSDLSLGVASGGKVSIQILNDKGEKYEIVGYGAGVGSSAKISIEQGKEFMEQLFKFIKGAKVVTEYLEKIKKENKLEFTGPSETNGGILKGMHWKAYLTADQIRAKDFFIIGEIGGDLIAAGGKLGLIRFGSMRDVVMLDLLPIWGLFINLGLSTFSLGGTAKISVYYLSDVKKLPADK